MSCCREAEPAVGAEDGGVLCTLHLKPQHLKKMLQGGESSAEGGGTEKRRRVSFDGKPSVRTITPEKAAAGGTAARRSSHSVNAGEGPKESQCDVYVFPPLSQDVREKVRPHLRDADAVVGEKRLPRDNHAWFMWWTLKNFGQRIGVSAVERCVVHAMHDGVIPVDISRYPRIGSSVEDFVLDEMQKADKFLKNKLNALMECRK